MERSNVDKGMTRRASTVLLAALVACTPSKGAEKPKTGTGSGSDTQSMKDTPDPGGVGGGAGSGGGAVAGGGGDPVTGGGGGTNDVDKQPPIVFPNQDPDPQQARAQVDQYLTVARASLAQTPPDPDNALKQARQALAVDAANIDAAAMVAFAYYHKKLYDTAELVLDELFKRPPAKQNPQVYYVYGLVYDRTNRPDQAVLAFRKAVELNPNFASALVDLGVHQLQNKQYTEAQQTFEKVTRDLHRSDAITLTALASAYRGRTGDYPPGSGERNRFIQSAETTYRQALSANPGYGPAYYDLGLLYLDSDPFPQGSGAMDNVARLNAAKGFFDQYKQWKDFDPKLYDERMKDYNKAMKRATKKAKAPAGTPKKGAP
jgi:tetratricopeptide (TPR) repeat protein